MAAPRAYTGCPSRHLLCVFSPDGVVNLCTALDITPESAAPRSLAPPGVPGAHQRIRAFNGGRPTSMRPADSYCEGAVVMCLVTAWMSRSARCRGLRRAFAGAPAAV